MVTSQNFSKVQVVALQPIAHPANHGLPGLHPAAVTVAEAVAAIHPAPLPALAVAVVADPVVAVAVASGNP